MKRILEIRAGEGGQVVRPFVAELSIAYQRFVDRKA